MQVCVQLPTRLRARLHACKYAHPPARTHARTLQRILSRCFRVPLRPAMGMTDIDQKIVERAAESATTAHTLARHFEVAFFWPVKSRTRLSAAVANARGAAHTRTWGPGLRVSSSVTCKHLASRCLRLSAVSPSMSMRSSPSCRCVCVRACVRACVRPLIDETVAFCFAGAARPWLRIRGTPPLVAISAATPQLSASPLASLFAVFNNRPGDRTLGADQGRVLRCLRIWRGAVP